MNNSPDGIGIQSNLLRRLLIDEEGLDLNAYKDKKGIWHIGIGHNTEIDQTDEELAVLGDYDDPSTLAISEEQAHALFDIDVEDAYEDVAAIFSKEALAALGETRAAVILSMVFQMGGGGVRKFKNFVAAVKSGDFDTASDEMLFANAAKTRQSAWFKQTPDRCQRAADAMRVGSFTRYEQLEQRIDQVDSPLAGFTDQELIAELARRLGV